MSSVLPPQPEHSEAVLVAAQWLADQAETQPQVVHILCTRFGLSALQACEACKWPAISGSTGGPTDEPSRRVPPEGGGRARSSGTQIPS